MKKILTLTCLTWCVFALSQKKMQISNHSNFDSSFISKIELTKNKTKHCFEFSISRVGLGKYQDYSKLLQRVTKKPEVKYHTALGFSIKGEVSKRYYYPVSPKFNYKYYRDNNKEKTRMKIHATIYKTDSIPVLIIDSVKFKK